MVISTAQSYPREDGFMKAHGDLGFALAAGRGCWHEAISNWRLIPMKTTTTSELLTPSKRPWSTGGKASLPDLPPLQFAILRRTMCRLALNQ